MEGGSDPGEEELSEPRARLWLWLWCVFGEEWLVLLERKESRSRLSPVGMPFMDRSRSSQFEPDLVAGAEQSMVGKVKGVVLCLWV